MTTTGLTKACLYCEEPLHWEQGRGWVHPGGGTYAMRCDDCGWSGAPYPSPSHCPRCGHWRNMRDSHCALVVRS